MELKSDFLSKFSTSIRTNKPFFFLFFLYFLIYVCIYFIFVKIPFFFSFFGFNFHEKHILYVNVMGLGTIDGTKAKHLLVRCDLETNQAKVGGHVTPRV